MIKLDPLRPLRDDFRELADKMGFHVEKIFKCKSNLSCCFEMDLHRRWPPAY